MTMRATMADLRRTSRPPEEVLARLIVNGEAFARFLCSPHDLRTLAYGWLFTQGIIDSPADAHVVRACKRSGEIRVTLRAQPRVDPDRYTPVLSSGCGGGLANATLYSQSIARNESTLQVAAERLQQVVHDMYEAFHALPGHRGTHCAALAGIHPMDALILATDIGRHNAVDKVIGHALLDGCDFGELVLATSGRISSDMLLKAHRAGIPVVVSQHAVTSLSVRLADSAGIAVVARFEHRDQEIYGCVDRVVVAEPVT